MQLQFDVGRGTAQQLSKLNVSVNKLNAVFLTHLYSDRSEGLVDVAQLRWHFASKGPFPIPGGPLSVASYEEAALESGYSGNVVVGSDLLKLRLPVE